MVKRDIERIKRLSGILEEAGIDCLVVLDDINIKYLAGNTIDYSLVFLDVKEGTVNGLVNIMEAERASQVTWLDNIYVYLRPQTEYDGGFETVRGENLYDALSKVLREGRIGIPYDKVSHKQYMQISEALGGELVDATEYLWRARKIKTRFELDIMVKSGELVDFGIHKAITISKEGVTEKEIADTVKCEMFKYGADRVFDFLIVASGLNSANPHWRASNKKLEKGDPITFDFVASIDGYFGDETRTVFLGEPKNELKKIYEVVLEAQVAAVEAVEPGVKTSEVDAVARKIIEDAGYGKYFIHSTGHGIGLEVHEPPRLSKTDDTVIEEGMVLTVEPGIYIQGLGGVRIEDMVYVDKSGARVLTKLNKAYTII